jgi:hypothetical protein
MPIEPVRLLVVANRTCPCPGVVDAIRTTLPADSEVLVTCPALNGRLAHYVSDVDEAVEAARDRLMAMLALLADAGIAAGGVIGDADPLTAIEDALATFPASRLLIATLPAPDSNWLERGLIDRSRERFGLPVEHVVSHYGLAEVRSTGRAAA